MAFDGRVLASSAFSCEVATHRGVGGALQEGKWIGYFQDLDIQNADAL